MLLKLSSIAFSRCCPYGFVLYLVTFLNLALTCTATFTLMVWSIDAKGHLLDIWKLVKILCGVWASQYYTYIGVLCHHPQHVYKMYIKSVDAVLLQMSILIMRKWPVYVVLTPYKWRTPLCNSLVTTDWWDKQSAAVLSFFTDTSLPTYFDSCQ